MMKKTKKQKLFWVWYHAGMLLWAFLSSMVIKQFHEGNPFPDTFLVTFLSIFFISSGIGYLASYMTIKASRLSLEKLRKRLLPALLIFYAGAFLISNIVISLCTLGWFVHQGRDLNRFIPHLLRNELNFANSSFALWLMFFTIAFFYVLWQKSSKREQALTRENLKYRYNTLKAQVNPHFLFNSFNTLSELIYVDTQKADDYIQKLSGIYRYILENEENELISLQEEIKFVERYMDLQNVRDAGKSEISINVPAPENYEIIPVSLQILIENAFKHNEVSDKSPLKIEVSLQEDHLVVSNHKQKKNRLENSTGKGLANLSERAKLITKKELVVHDSEKQFEVWLPLIKKKL